MSNGARRPNRTITALRLALDMSQEQYAATLGSSDREVRAWEAGTVRCPQTRSLIALHALHGTTTPEDLGFTSRRRAASAGTVTLTDPAEAAVYRRNLLGLVVAAAFTSRPLPALSGLLDDHSANTAVGTADVARIEQANRALYTADLLVGGAATSSAALLAQYRKATALLHGTFANVAQRSAMHSAVGHFGSTIGFMLFDVGEHVKARQVYLASLRIAGDATDRWALHAIICSELARQSCHLGATAEADELIRIAHSAEAELTPTTKAMLHAVHATATAAAGDREATARYVGLAEDTFADSTPSSDPEWITWFNAAELHGETGAALAVLATHHDDLRDDAASRLSTSAATYGPGEQRSTALALTRLAAVHATRQDASAAVKAAHHALDIAERLRSPRIVDTLVRLTDTLQPLAARPGVSGIGRRISTLAAATT